MRFLKRAAILGISVLVVSCSGGGGSSDGSSSSGGDTVSSGSTWLVKADVSSDTCGERIAAVNQPFIIDVNGGSAVVDTSIVKLQGTVSGGGITVGFDETNGNCNRSYTATFSDVTGSISTVQLVNHSNCGGQECQSEWTGTATQAN